MKYVPCIVMDLRPFFFPRAFFHQHVHRSCSPKANEASRSPGREAASRHRVLLAVVNQEVMRLLRKTLAVALACERELERSWRMLAVRQRPVSAAHLETQADWAAGRNQASMAAARCRARRRRNVAASVPNLPPTSRPTTTSRHLRARMSSGYV